MTADQEASEADAQAWRLIRAIAEAGSGSLTIAQVGPDLVRLIAAVGPDVALLTTAGHGAHLLQLLARERGVSVEELAREYDATASLARFEADFEEGETDA